MKLPDKVIHNIHVVITMKRPVTLAAVCFQTPSWPFPWNTPSTVNNHKVLSKSKAEKLRQDLIDLTGCPSMALGALVSVELL